MAQHGRREAGMALGSGSAQFVRTGGTVFLTSSQGIVPVLTKCVSYVPVETTVQIFYRQKYLGLERRNDLVKFTQGQFTCVFWLERPCCEKAWVCFAFPSMLGFGFEASP